MSVSYWFLLLALLAEIVGTIGGFGSSVYFVPLANIYFDFQTVLGLTAVFHLASNVSKIALFRKGVDRKLILYIGLPSVVFVIIGGLLSKVLSSIWLEVALGVFLVAFSLLFLIKRRLEIEPRPRPAMIGGALSGFTAGLLGSGGAIRGVTMAAFNLEKSTFIATSAVIDLAIDATRTVVYYQNGYIGTDAWRYLPYLFVIGLVGTWLGRLILQNIPQDSFRRLALFLVLGIGLLTLVSLWVT
ncbi:sulfite exporter TauE/SafE family protein [Neolewinella persica]|uniref:sulfite exporter TauE/SafE family protein n=1 Tax=Neolewinella persica TaxID=70998 RepID=UPI000370E7BF|nr:sulfite exporter TauE/SafE family protein [Neolewinella persica]